MSILVCIVRRRCLVCVQLTCSYSGLWKSLSICIPKSGNWNTSTILPRWPTLSGIEMILRAFTPKSMAFIIPSNTIPILASVLVSLNPSFIIPGWLMGVEVSNWAILIPWFFTVRLSKAWEVLTIPFWACTSNTIFCDVFNSTVNCYWTISILGEGMKAVDLSAINGAINWALNT